MLMFSGVEPPGLWVLEKPARDRKADKAEDEDEEGEDEEGDAVMPSEDAASSNTQSPSKRIPRSKVELTVGVLGSGQIFGELSVLNTELPSPVSAIAFTPVEVYCFEGEMLLGLGAKFSPTCMDALNESLSLHNPPSEKVNYYYQSKFAWEKRKIGLLKIWGKREVKKGKDKKSEGFK